MTTHAPKTRLILTTGVVIDSHGGDYEAGADVHVLRPDGTEAGFWSWEEWRDDPQLVMGAILNCARDAGRPVKATRKLSKRTRQ